MRLLYDNVFDLATLTPLTENPGYPVENMQDSRLCRIYKSTDDAAQTVVCNMGAAVDVNCCVFSNHNFTTAAIIKIQGSSEDAWGGPPVDETLAYNAGNIKKYFTGGSYQYWRLYVDDDTNPDTYIKAGRVFIGEYYEMPGQASGISVPVVTTSKKYTSKSGQIYGDLNYQYKRAELRIPKVTDAQREEMISIFETIDNSIPVYLDFFVDSDNTRENILYCTIDNTEFAYHQVSTFWTLNLTFSEAF